MVHNPADKKDKHTTSGQAVFLSKGPKSIRLADIGKELETQHLTEHKLLVSLQEISRVLTVEVDIQKILEDMATILAKTLGAKWVNFWELTPDEKAVYIAAHYGMQPGYMENSRLHPVALGTGWIGKAVQIKQTYGSTDMPRDARMGTIDKSWAEVMKKQGVRAVVCSPVISGNKANGGICIYYTKTHEFTDFEMQLVTVVANQAATAMENARIFKELQTRIDELEKFKEVTVGREIKMVGLKEEIEVLKKELEKYKTSA